MTDRHIAVAIAGSEVLLLADKALYWPEQRMLCVADAHFGKAAAFRAMGQPVPHGTTSDNLTRLDAILAVHQVDRLVFLGDFLHARKARTTAVLDALHVWRHRHPALQCTLVRGNHDRHAGDPPADLMIDVVDEPMVIGPFALSHSLDAHPTHHVIAGHIHPAFELRGNAHQRLRLPCYVTNHRVTVLPSFGGFTGGYDIDARMGDRIFVTDGSGIWPATFG